MRVRVKKSVIWHNKGMPGVITPGFFKRAVSYQPPALSHPENTSY